MTSSKQSVLSWRRFLSFAREQKDFEYPYDFDDHCGSLLEETLLRLGGEYFSKESLTRENNEEDDTFVQENVDGKWSAAASQLLLELLQKVSSWNCVNGWEPYDEDDHGPSYVKQFWDTAAKLTGERNMFHYEDNFSDDEDD